MSDSSAPAPAPATAPTAAAPAARPVVLTCAQPSGAALTLGNYLGAVARWTRFLDTHECYFGLVDLHSLTTPADLKPTELRANSYSLLAQYVAAGLDPARCTLFLQSHVIGHTELSWVLGCVTSIGELSRMTQFKDKSGKKGELVGSGLLFYPVLMAADILLYNADVVPVGEDQRQHLELCRDVAQRFNTTFGETFRVPEINIAATGARIRSLQDPTKKMSKSDPDANATLFLTDPPALLRKKIMSAVTDSGSEVRDADDKPGISNLLTILSACTGRPVAELEAEFAGQGYGKFKAAVADAVVATLAPVQARYTELSRDRAALDQIFAAGAASAQRRANRVLSKVYRKVGLVERAR